MVMSNISYTVPLVGSKEGGTPLSYRIFYDLDSERVNDYVLHS